MKRSCCGLFGLLLSMICIDSMALTSSDKLPVIRIQAAELTARAIGLELGRQSKALFPDIEQRYDAHLASLFTQTHFDDLRQQRLPQLVQQLPEAYREEWQGIFDSWSISHVSKLGDGHLSLHEYQLLNLLPDLGLPPGGIGIGVFGKVSEAGTIVGRNLDWQSSPELRALQAITVYQYKDRTVVNPGFAGITAMVNGFNQHGLFLAYFDAEPYSPYRQFKTQSSQQLSANVFMLRQALETRQSVAQASAYLAKRTYNTERSLLLADKKEVQVLEYTSTGRTKVRHWYSPTQAAKPWQHLQQIAVVGCHVLAELKNQCSDAKDSVRWQRLGELLDFSAAEPADVASVGNILSDTTNRHYELFNQHTVQSLLYLPANNNLYLYAAPVTGQPVDTPVYMPYPTLVSNGTSASGIRINMSWLIWLLLITLLGVVLWVLRRY